MTTKKQITKLWQPLLAEHTDLHKYNAGIILKPARHVLRGIQIQKTLRARHFELFWFVHLLVRPDFSYAYNFWDHVLPPKAGCWEWSDENLAKSFEAAITADILPALRRVTSVKQLLEDHETALGCPDTHQYKRWTNFTRGASTPMVVLCMNGRFDEARAKAQEMLDLIAKHHRKEVKFIISDAAIDRWDRFSNLVLADDRSEISRTLHAWEEESIKRWKLEAIWEPTPFPFEVQT